MAAAGERKSPVALYEALAELFLMCGQTKDSLLTYMRNVAVYHAESHALAESSDFGRMRMARLFEMIENEGLYVEVSPFVALLFMNNFMDLSI